MTICSLFYFTLFYFFSITNTTNGKKWGASRTLLSILFHIFQLILKSPDWNELPWHRTYLSFTQTKQLVDHISTFCVARVCAQLPFGISWTAKCAFHKLAYNPVSTVNLPTTTIGFIVQLSTAKWWIIFEVMSDQILLWLCGRIVGG